MARNTIGAHATAERPCRQVGDGDYVTPHSVRTRVGGSAMNNGLVSGDRKLPTGSVQRTAKLPTGSVQRTAKLPTGSVQRTAKPSLTAVDDVILEHCLRATRARCSRPDYRARFLCGSPSSFALRDCRLPAANAAFQSRCLTNRRAPSCISSVRSNAWRSTSLIELLFAAHKDA